MPRHRIVLEFSSPQALLREFEAHLCKGGAMADAAADVHEGDDCDLELVHPATGATLTLPARVVWAATAGSTGVGLAIDDFTPTVRDRIRAFVDVPAKRPAERRAHQPVHERVRHLSGPAQVKLAREGDLSERVALERIYGKTVWEALLRNPRVTPPEVARIARKRTVPAPLLELVAANASWLSSGQVRRALLSNTRLGGDLIEKVLRATPKAELKLVPQQTAYPSAVRQAAKRKLGR